MLQRHKKRYYFYSNDRVKVVNIQSQKINLNVIFLIRMCRRASWNRYRFLFLPVVAVTDAGILPIIACTLRTRFFLPEKVFVRRFPIKRLCESTYTYFPEIVQNRYVKFILFGRFVLNKLIFKIICCYCRIDFVWFFWITLMTDVRKPQSMFVFVIKFCY